MARKKGRRRNKNLKLIDNHGHPKPPRTRSKTDLRPVLTPYYWKSTVQPQSPLTKTLATYHTARALGATYYTDDNNRTFKYIPPTKEGEQGTWYVKEFRLSDGTVTEDSFLAHIDHIKP